MKAIKMKNNFYIYIHVKPHNGEIFYVGKGRNKRAYSKSYRNTFWHNIVQKHSFDVFILENNLTEQEAFELEMKYIKRVGRRDLKTGTLVNMSDGGEGNAGRIFSDEHRKKMSEAKKGRKGPKHSEETKKKIAESKKGNKCAKGYKHTDEAKKKMSAAHKGRKHSDETKKKISETQTGMKRSEEFKRKISKLHKGKKLSDEHKQKISDALKCKKRPKHSDEHRKKLSESRKQYRAQRKLKKTNPNEII